MTAGPNPAPGFRSRPDHRVEVLPETRRVRVALAGAVLAESGAALVVVESGYPPVHYFARAHVAMALLTPSAHRTRCPFKGEASYWTLGVGGRAYPDAVWCYETPYDEVAALAGRLAFWLERIPGARLEFG